MCVCSFMCQFDNSMEKWTWPNQLRGLYCIRFRRSHSVYMFSLFLSLFLFHKSFNCWTERRVYILKWVDILKLFRCCQIKWNWSKKTFHYDNGYGEHLEMVMLSAKWIKAAGPSIYFCHEIALNAHTQINSLSHLYTKMVIFCNCRKCMFICYWMIMLLSFQFTFLYWAIVWISKTREMTFLTKRERERERNIANECIWEMNSKRKKWTGKKEQQKHRHTDMYTREHIETKPRPCLSSSSNEFAAGWDHDRTSYNLRVATIAIQYFPMKV